MYTVLHTESSTGWGGQENRTLRESIGLRDMGARIIVLCQPGSVLGERASDHGIQVEFCRMKKSYDLVAVKDILKLIRTEHVDVINTHSGRDSFLAGIAGRMSSRRPVIVRTRHLALPITSRASYSLIPHRVVTVSRYVRRYLISKGLRPERVVAIPTGIDLERFDPDRETGDIRQELGIKPDIPLVGTVAILRTKKGHHVLLDAIPKVLKRVPDALFLFAGNGPQHQNLSNRIQELGLSDHVMMLGLRDDIPGLLNSIDLFVLPTLQEALGTSFIEAMAMKKPVVGTAIDGVSEVIRDRINGLLVRPDDPASLADAITRLLKDREKAATMGNRGREIVLENYTTDRMCRDMHRLYSELLEERR